MHIRHPWRILSIALLASLLVLAAYAGWLMWDTARQLEAAKVDARSAEEAVFSSGDAADAEPFLEDFANHADAARARTTSPGWRVMSALPVVGDDVRGVGAVSKATRDVAQVLQQQFTPTTAAAISSLRPRNGTIDVQSVRTLQEPLAVTGSALTQASETLDAEDSSQFIGPLQRRYDEVKRSLIGAAGAVTIANRAFSVLPGMLGADGPRNYLLILQNNAEIRASGGLPGLAVLLTSRDGHLSLTKQRSADSFGSADTPTLRLTREEKELYGANMALYFQDANFTPNFTRSAKLWAARWQQEEGQRIDGVLSLDVVTLSYVLRAIGPVTVDGTVLTADNVVQKLLSSTYARFASPASQDAFYKDVAAEIFARLLSTDNHVVSLASAVRRGLEEHRVQLRYFRPQGQGLVRILLSRAHALRLLSPRAVGIFFNDATLGKMSYYLRYDVGVVSTSCEGGTNVVEGEVRVRSVAPQNSRNRLVRYVTGYGLPKSSAGMQLIDTVIYSPVHSTVRFYRPSELQFDHVGVRLRKRQALRTSILLRPGESRSLHWEASIPSGIAQSVDVAVTPSISTVSPEVQRLSLPCS